LIHSRKKQDDKQQNTMNTKQKLKLIFSNPINLLYFLKDYWLKYFLIILPFLLVMNNKSNAQVQNMVWAREGMGTGVDQGNAVTVDAAGNVYTTGYFESTCDFDPGAGVTNLTSVGKEDIFIMKSDASGNLLWVKSVGGTGDDEGKTIAVDASGNVYIGGSFSGTADLDPGAGTVSLTQAQSYYTASFVLKLNTSGNFVWVKQFGGVTAAVRLNKIILDATANVLVTGGFVGVQDFDPNAGTVNLTPVYQDVYILKLTSAGHYLWAKQIKGANALDYTEAYDMETDLSGNIIIGGIIHGTFDFDPGAGTANITSMGFGDCFVAKYTSAGIYIWSGMTGGSTASTVVWNSELAVDAAGYIYVTDYCSGGIIDFDITAGVNNINITGSKTSIQKLNPNGNLVWVKILGTSCWSVPICVGPTGVYLSGYFSGTVDFNPGAAVFNLTATVIPYPSHYYDCYLLNLDTAGNFISALKYGSRFNDNVEDLWLDAPGNIYTTGNYYGDGDFDPGAGVRMLYSNGATDIFIQKLNSVGGFTWANGFGGVTYHTVNSVSKNVGTYASSTGYFDGSAMTSSGSRQEFKGGTDIMVNKVSTTGYSFDIWYAMGGPGNDAGTGIISDASDNVYVTGYFEQTADFAPTHWEPSYPLTSAGNKDIFILKINSSGDLVWAKRIGGTNEDMSNAIALDNSGNLYVTGYYQGTVDFNPGVATNNLTSAGSLDAFSLKLDTAGNYIWAKSLGGISSDLGYDITVDAAGNVITSGSFNATADFDPSAATFNLTTVASIDAFIVKLNAAGNFVWAKSFGSVSNESARCLITDASNNIICAGSYGGATDFDPNAGVTSLTPPNNLGEIFLLQLTSAGNFSWVKSMGGAGADKVTGLTKDVIGNIYTAGSFTGTADLNPSTTTTFYVTSSGSNDVFINCYRPVADASWTKTIGGTSFDEAEGIAVDNACNVYTIGNFGGTVDFDFNAGVFSLTSMGANDMFALKINQSSPLPVELVSFNAKAVDNKEVLCQWTTASEINNDYFTVERSQNGRNFEEAGKVIGAGNSTSSLDYSFTDEQPFNGTSYYRLKQTDFNGDVTYSKIVKVTIIKTTSAALIAYPNPAHNYFTARFASQEETAAQVALFDISGKKILFENFTVSEGVNSQSMDLTKIPSGVYIVELSAGEIKSTLKLVKK
jgi:hypothetical protein